MDSFSNGLPISETNNLHLLHLLKFSHILFHAMFRIRISFHSIGFSYFEIIGNFRQCNITEESIVSVYARMKPLKLQNLHLPVNFNCIKNPNKYFS